jgi:glycosyltransferase involved in cell wall biosynthesis
LCGDLSAAGGAERLVFEEAQALRGSGLEVLILSFKFHGGVTFSGHYDSAVEVIRGGSGITGLATGAIALVQILTRWHPDLVIAMSPNDCARLVVPCTLLRTPYITHINGTQFWFPPEQDLTKYAWSYRRVLRRVLSTSPGHAEFIPRSMQGIGPRRRLRIELTAVLHRLAVRRARQRIAFSRRMAWEIELMYGRPAVSIKGAFPESILAYVPRSDPCSDYRIGGGPVILNVNRLEPRKRVEVAITAFELLLASVPDAVLLIGGVGPSAPRLRELVVERRIENRVRFLGFVPELDLWDWLAGCDVFIHPNWAEFAIAPYEALALGTNVVWSTEMEVDPTLAQYKHLFSAAPEPRAMADQLLAALKTPRALQSERETLRPFSWEHYFAQLLLIVDAEVHAARGGRPSA